MPKTLIGWAFAILVTVWIVRNPAAAGATVHHWINSIIAFFSSLAGG